MLVYNYHPETKIYWGSEEAFPDPLSEGNYLVPADATTIAPPVLRDGECAVFAGDSWVVQTIEQTYAPKLELSYTDYLPQLLVQMKTMQEELAKLQKKMKKLKKK